jgi:lipid-A-disaccharide synthase
MSEPLRLFILAGEASGDRLGASLVEALRRDGPVALMGVGGPDLQGQGLNSIFPMDDLAVMGWSDVLKSLPLLLWRAHQTRRAIERLKPDVAVFIDAQVFSKVVAGRLARRGSPVPRLLYVAPSVWAWGPERALALRPLFDAVLAVLPFEPPIMARLGGPPTHYVGHPALERMPFRAVSPPKGPLLLLPGSRKGELRRHLPLFRALAPSLARHPAVTELVLPTLPGLVGALEAEVAGWGVPVRIVTGRDRDAPMAEAIAALAVSGTVTLELALAGIPMVVTYAADPGQAKRYQSLGHDQPIALPNIISGATLVPEIRYLEPPDPARLSAAITALLDQPEARTAQIASFRALRGLMQKGAPEAPLMQAAPLVRAVAQRRLIGS